MTAIDFPDSPSNGTTHTAGGTTWTYNSTKGVWEINSSNSFVASSSSSAATNLLGLFWTFK